MVAQDNFYGHRGMLNSNFLPIAFCRFQIFVIRFEIRALGLIRRAAADPTLDTALLCEHVINSLFSIATAESSDGLQTPPQSPILKDSPPPLGEFIVSHIR